MILEIFLLILQLHTCYHFKPQVLNKPLVTVVILNYNGRNYLQQFLPSVIAGTYGHMRIIVADNGSTDDSVAFVKANFKEVELLLLAENYGFAGGYNRALANIEADYFVLLNSDVEVLPGWIEPVITLMEKNLQVAACQPKILSFHNKEQFEYAGAAGGWLDVLGYPFSRGRVFDDCEWDTHQFDDVTNIFWASGAALFIRANVFKEANGFYEFFFAHMEEIDLCWRMQNMGYQISYCPHSIVYHVGGGTLPKGNSRKVFLNFRNNLIMLQKNLPLSESLWKLPLRFGLDALFAWKNLLNGNSVAFMAVIKAHMAFIKWFIVFREKSTTARKPMKTLDGVYNGLIIWDYFIHKRKRFFEIVKKNL